MFTRLTRSAIPPLYSHHVDCPTPTSASYLSHHTWANLKSRKSPLHYHIMGSILQPKRKSILTSPWAVLDMRIPPPHSTSHQPIHHTYAWTPATSGVFPMSYFDGETSRVQPSTSRGYLCPIFYVGQPQCSSF